MLIPFATDPGGIKNDTAIFNKIICLFFGRCNICIGERAQTTKGQNSAQN